MAQMTVNGKGLTVPYHNRSDVAPLIRMSEFDFNVGLLGIIYPVKHITSVILNDMVITIPPRWEPRSYCARRRFRFSRS